MTLEERSKRLMSALLLRNDDGSWAGSFPSAEEDLANQHRIIKDAFCAAVAEELERLEAKIGGLGCTVEGGSYPDTFDTGWTEAIKAAVAAIREGKP